MKDERNNNQADEKTAGGRDKEEHVSNLTCRAQPVRHSAHSSRSEHRMLTDQRSMRTDQDAFSKLMLTTVRHETILIRKSHICVTILLIRAGFIGGEVGKHSGKTYVSALSLLFLGLCLTLWRSAFCWPRSGAFFSTGAAALDDSSVLRLSGGLKGSRESRTLSG